MTNNLVGLVLYWELEHCFYIEHFCVLPELRGHRYGLTCLLDLLAEQGKPLILEIDPPVDRTSAPQGIYVSGAALWRIPIPMSTRPIIGETRAMPWS